MTDSAPKYLIDDEDEPSTIWVPGHLETSAARSAALSTVIAEWFGLVEWFDLLETTVDRVCAPDAPLVWLRPEATKAWHGVEPEPWSDCEADDEGAVAWTALRIPI